MESSTKKLDELLEQIYENEDRDELLNDLFAFGIDPSSHNFEEGLLKSLDGMLNAESEEYSQEELQQNVVPFLSKSITVFPSSFLTDLPYYKVLSKIKPFREDDIEFRFLNYDPYEPFVCNDRVVETGLSSFTPIGCFVKKTPYPAILKNGRIWMSLIPHEVNTMKDIFASFSGSVLLYGLGLGYAAFEASQKSKVKKVTVIEYDKDLIRLFKQRILPFFPHSEKIEIRYMDALDFAFENKDKASYDVLFADLWHNGEDGLPLYSVLTKNEGAAKRSFYWIENDILEYFSRIYARYLLCVCNGGVMSKKTRKQYPSSVNAVFDAIEKFVPSPSIDNLLNRSSLKRIISSLKIEKTDLR